MEHSHLKIIEDFENPVFKRKEIKIAIALEKFPSLKELGKLLSEKFGKPEENIVIKKMNGSFGTKELLVAANIYHSKEEKDRVERKPKKLKTSQEAVKVE